ncbi:hypothetical protein NT06LI_2810, partial [Listeria innocua FSL J1-023]
MVVTRQFHSFLYIRLNYSFKTKEMRFYFLNFLQII